MIKPDPDKSNLLKENLPQEVSKNFAQIEKVSKESFSLDTKQELFKKVTERINLSYSN